ncbi:MAG: hypothetical protein Q7J34_07625 [Bacteroidales bacterium]|nr:hypothetical protein [Bacteroidales bacterium]
MENNKTYGIIGTLAFHAMLLLLLFYFALRTPLPLPGEEGVEVNLGYSTQGMGDIQPPEIPASQQASIPSSTRVQKEDLVTQDIEDAPAVAEKAKEKPSEKKSTIPVQKPAEVKPQEPKVNTNAMYTGKQQGTQNSGNQGISGGVGDQGKPDGTPGSNNYDGQGGSGNGIAFSLDGRGKVYLNQPPYTSSEQGRVVVEIIVDRLGNVTRATAGKKIPGTTIGTTTTDQVLWNAARQAALRSKFTADPSAAEEQRGYISYNFVKLQ